jgi:steroid delta-isomerase-like uncharacterized protein
MGVADDRKAQFELWLKEINAHNVDIFDQVLTPDFVEHEEVPGLDLTGPALPKAFFGMMFSAFPDLEMDVHNLTVDGDYLWSRYTITGTHKGEFMGIPPTDKKIEIQGFDLLRLEGDRAAEHWGVTDQMTMMQQLGLMPEAPSA